MNWSRLSNIGTPAALKRILDRHFGGSLDEFMAGLNRESDRLIRTDLKKALLLTKKTAGLEHLVSDQYRAHLYRIWARHYHLSGRYSEARKLYDKAIRLFENLRDYNSRAKAQKALLDVLMYLGRYDEAISTGNKSLRYYRRSGSEIDAGQVMTNLGNLYHRLDQNLQALRYYDRAFEIFKKSKHEYAMAVVQFNRGNALTNLNKHDEAERLYRQAADIYRSLGMELAACQADYSLAYLAFLKGNYSESLSAFARAAQEFRRLGDERCLALTELDLAEVNLHLNLYSQTIEDARSVAGDFRRLGMAYERAKALYFAAAGYFAFGDFDLSLKLARQSLGLFEKEHNQPGQVLCRFLMAKVNSREQHYGKALDEFRQIAAFYKKQGDLRHYYDTRLAWLEALVLSGSTAAAGRMIANLEKTSRAMAGYQKFVFLMLAGDMYRHGPEAAKAGRYYRRAISQAEKLWASIFPDEIQRFFWMDKLAAYNRLAAIYLDKGRNRQAFEILERGQILASAGPEGVFPGYSHHKIPQHIEEERRRLKSYLRRAVMPVGTSERRLAATSSIKAAEYRLWKIERNLRRQNHRPHAKDMAGDFKLREAQKKLQPDEILLRFVCREDDCGVFIVGVDSFEYLPYDASVDELRGLLARFYFMINRLGAEERDDSVIASLIERISDKIWRPIEAGLPSVRRLSIVPDGILSRMPFYTLSDDRGRAIFEKYDIRLFSSAIDLSRKGLSEKTDDRFHRVSVISVSDSELPGASSESLSVARYFPKAKIFANEAAVSACLFDVLRHRGGLVHLIAHAAQSYENHLFSRILLADGPLYPFDLISRPVQSGLVVLSGCQTGDPGLYYYSDSLSLAQVFLMAGAREVVASYWPVSDEIACRFMDAFYRHLSEGKIVYQALKMAMLDMRAQSADIRHWAPFYLACR